MKCQKSNFDDCVSVIKQQLKKRRLPENLLYFVIAIEDRRFLIHKGFDLLSIARVFTYRLAGYRRGGASTISQQLVRTITNDREKTIARKIREIILAYKIEGIFTKREIIQAYLEIAYLGNNIIGVRQLSKNIHESNIYTLNDYDFSIIASCLKYPYSEKNKGDWKANVARRSKYARKLFCKSGWIKKTHQF